MKKINHLTLHQLKALEWNMQTTVSVAAKVSHEKPHNELLNKAYEEATESLFKIKERIKHLEEIKK